MNADSLRLKCLSNIGRQSVRLNMSGPDAKKNGGPKAADIIP